MSLRLQINSQVKQQSKSSRLITSVAIIIAALGLTYIPIPGLRKTVIIVSGTELQEPLQQLEAKFEQANPNIKLELEFQGSQEIVNNYIDQKNKFQPTILIPANGEILSELSDRLRTTNQTEPFYDSPRPLARTLLVGIAWPERGKVLFPNGRFQWSRLEQAMQAGNWEKVGGSSNWGSFDFVTTDPTRSNSGQLTLNLWTQSKLGGTINADSFNNSSVQLLFSLIKKSVYQPPRSTDILLQEFIVRGPNDADVATVYESIALHRWQQSAASKGKPYQIYYLDPSIETTATAAIVRRDVDAGTAKAAKEFLDFLTQPEQQAVFVQYGFRPVNNNVDFKTVPNSPWSQNIPGAEVKPSMQILPPPDNKTITEIQRQWERAN
ncbi:substrate-binding domain-containing protein [Nostoc sp. CHAB 5844]|nr:substrate-binding domain-containing protein [Nostoc sp. CHAB 5844]